MSNPYGIVGLTYDGEDLQLPDFTLFLTIIKGLNETPAQRGEDIVIPRRAGRTEGNRINDILSIVLAGQATGGPTTDDRPTNQSEYRTMMLYVRTLFRSNRERAALVALLENGSTATIQARPMNILVPDEVPGAYASLNIELEGYDDWEIL